MEKKDYKEQLTDAIYEQRETIRMNQYSIEDVEQAINHHLQQLKKAGATLEDDVCLLLRKVKRLAEAEKRLSELTEEWRWTIDHPNSRNGHSGHKNEK